MLKRNDLAKKFELIVKQEILNHNKSILASNMATEKLRLDIEALTNEFNKKLDKINTQTLSFCDGLKGVSEKMSEALNEVSNNFSHIQNEANIDIKKSLKHLNEKTLNKYVLLDDFEAGRELGLKLILDLKTAQKITRNLFIDEMKAFQKTFYTSLKEIDAKFLEKISRIDKENEELDAEIVVYKVDSVGLLKEIAVLKKELYVLKKEIENLHTVMERIKTQK